MTITKKIRMFSTFETAKICGVFHTTVINWANRGHLKVHFTPGGHRRIALPDLLEFMRRFEMPVPRDLIARERSILVVEDDASMRHMLERALRDIPRSRIALCRNGIEALMMIGRDAPDLLILDIRIPQVNGLEICRLLRSGAQTQPIKIVAVTGAALSAHEEAFLKTHADAFFHKPLSPSELKAKVIELLGMDDAVSAASAS